MARRRPSRMCSLFCCLYPDLRFGDGERKYIHRGSFLTRESNVKGIRFSIFVSFYETKFYFEAIIGSAVDSFSGRTMKRIFRITSLVFLENWIWKNREKKKKEKGKARRTHSSEFNERHCRFLSLSKNFTADWKLMWNESVIQFFYFF